LAADFRNGWAAERLFDHLIDRLAEVLQVPPSSVVIAGSMSKLLRSVETALQEEIVLTVPSRSERRAHFLASPDWTIGRQLSHSQLASLAHQSRWVVIDERLVPFAFRSALPLYRELGNLMLVRSYGPVGGFATMDLVFAMVPPRFPRLAENHRYIDDQMKSDIVATLATLDDRRYLRAAIERVRRERLSLYRQLRKLNSIQPMRGAASFVTGDVARGSLESLRFALEAENIIAGYPESYPGRQLVRFAARSAPDHTRIVQSVVSWSQTL
jgi:histidinol-phosphate/aromatic aminotransferase/cobyric acid decarboxylase-like protein